MEEYVSYTSYIFHDEKNEQSSVIGLLSASAMLPPSEGRAKQKAIFGLIFMPIGTKMKHGHLESTPNCPSHAAPSP